MNRLNSREPSTASRATPPGQANRRLASREVATPRLTPSRPPTNDRVIASIRNWRRMWPARAPRARRMPISRVRSLTDTNMMFMMPMPPTTREMAADPPSRLVKIWVTELEALTRSAWLRMMKSSLRGGVILWRRRSRLPI